MVALFNEFLALGDSIWQHAEWMMTLFLGIIAFIVFWANPMLRNRVFKGLVPTVIPVLVDLREQKIFLVHRDKENGNLWTLAQEKYAEGVLATAKSLFTSEVVLPFTKFDLGNGRFLGGNVFPRNKRCRLDDYDDMKDISFWKWKRGKSYTVIIAETSVEKITAWEAEVDENGKPKGNKIELMYKYDEGRFVTFAEAKDLLRSGNSDRKMEIYARLFAFVESKFNKSNKENEQ